VAIDLTNLDCQASRAEMRLEMLFDDIVMAVTRQGLGPQFRESVLRRQEIHRRATDAGLSENDWSALTQLAVDMMLRAQKSGQQFDVLDFTDKVVAAYTTGGHLPEDILQ
jgi:hypothetical protein